MDAHAGVRRAIATFLEANEDMEMVGEAASTAEGLRQCASTRPDVVLVGITLQGPNGIEAIVTIRCRWPETRIVAMGSFQEEERMRAAIEAGASRYVLKDVSADELASAIRAAHATLSSPPFGWARNPPSA
jgi:DNA-binding NarL/FixJ family response regulator